MKICTHKMILVRLSQSWGSRLWVRVSAQGCVCGTQAMKVYSVPMRVSEGACAGVCGTQAMKVWLVPMRASKHETKINSPAEHKQHKCTTLSQPRCTKGEKKKSLTSVATCGNKHEN